MRTLQFLLNENGATLRADGDFGPRTEAAVRDFQKLNGLSSDGIAGPATAQALTGSGPGGGGSANEYTVAPGDTLAAIAAELLGDASRWREIYEANRDRVAHPSRISIGAKLRIPTSGHPSETPPEVSMETPAEAVTESPDATYTVRPGDSLVRIAERLTGDGTQWRDLYNANRGQIRDPGRLSVGWELTLPSSWNAKEDIGQGLGPEEDPGRDWRAGGGAETMEDGAYSSVYGNQSKNNPLLQVDRGQLTFDAEGHEGGAFHTRRAHWPGGNSGVTLGRGYDMGLRSRQTVFNDLVGSGVRVADARTLSQGAGLRSTAARDFTRRGDLPEIPLDAQKNLFNDVYLRYVGYVVEISDRSDVTAAYGRVDWDKLNPWIIDLVVDLRYRGDYTAASRRRVQPLMVANDLTGLKDLMADRAFWGNVPSDRFERRKLWTQESMQAEQVERSDQEEVEETDHDVDCDDKNKLMLNVGEADPKGVLAQSRLNPQVRVMAAKVVDALIKEGYKPYVFEGIRTYSRQDSLSSGVTGVSGGGSYHQYGLAVDIAVMDSRGNVSWNAPSAYWKRLGELGLQSGFTRWGGDWGDMVHLEYHPNRGPGERARSLENIYRAAGGYRDKNVDAGLLGVWEALGLPTDWSQAECILESTTGWDAVLAGSVKLRNGSKGETVRMLQNFLLEHGFSVDVDGEFGPATEAAVRAFQSAMSLIGDGVVGASTAGLLQM